LVAADAAVGDGALVGAVVGRAVGGTGVAVGAGAHAAGNVLAIAVPPKVAASVLRNSRRVKRPFELLFIPELGIGAVLLISPPSNVSDGGATHHLGFQSVYKFWHWLRQVSKLSLSASLLLRIELC
jgi:hypothetical protein